MFNYSWDPQENVHLNVQKKSLDNMKLKFKSSAPPDLYFSSISKMLTLMLNEQRAQRIDLANILRILNRQINQTNLQKQVDEYFEDDTKDIPEEEK